MKDVISDSKICACPVLTMAIAAFEMSLRAILTQRMGWQIVE